MALQTYSPPMKDLMLAIGKRMSSKPEDWITQTYISQDSSIHDFMLGDKEWGEMEAEVGVQFPEEGNLGEIADAMNLLPKYRIVAEQGAV